uniref:Uncharacterized protein n=1 Tax=Arundo donax TaxID=35708 RepID=A0A0A9AN85_ARUDO
MVDNHGCWFKSSAKSVDCVIWAERIWRSMPVRRLRCSLRRRLESYSRIFLRAMAASERGFWKVLEA